MERSVGVVQLAAGGGSLVFLPFLRPQVPRAALNVFCLTLTLCKTTVQTPSKSSEYYDYGDVYTL